MTHLQELLKHTSRSLYLSAKLLPPTIQDAFGIAYLLCRYADSIADTSLLPPEKRLHWISLFPQTVAQKNAKIFEPLVGEISACADNPYEAELLRNLPECLAEFQKLPSNQQQATQQVVQAVCEGMQIDLQTFPDEKSGQVRAFSNEQALINYCHLMGGAPGKFWSTLIADTVSLSVEKNTFLALGQDIGDALQIVNILRDLPRDLRIGRCYFPEEDLQSCGLKATDLLDAKNSARFEPIKQKWIAWGREKLTAAYAYFAALPKLQARHRAAVAWPALWAGDTLNKLSLEPNLLNPAVRVKIPRARIYTTMLFTPPILLSNFLFNQWLAAKISDGK